MRHLSRFIPKSLAALARKTLGITMIGPTTNIHRKCCRKSRCFQAGRQTCFVDRLRHTGKYHLFTMVFDLQFTVQSRVVDCSRVRRVVHEPSIVYFHDYCFRATYSFHTKTVPHISFKISDKSFFYVQFPEQKLSSCRFQCSLSRGILRL